ncbi:MAG: hypothetical protein APR56_09995 [Methanosaeta sp. SDB]|nr:MAG: hypothetical protein APR56_09995 [Methanosaeta sp. SDB]
MATMLLVGMVAAAETPIDLSTLGKKSEIKSSMTPLVITYTRDEPKTTTDAVDVRTLGRSFGTFSGLNVQPMELGASNPITYTPSFAISVSNRTSSRVTLYTPSFAIGNRTITTPAPMIFGGA